MVTKHWVALLLGFIFLFSGRPHEDGIYTPPTPNVVIIFMDDLGYGDLGVYRKQSYATPHIDRLAREGMRFTEFYAVQAVCSASRAGLLTGCYPNRIGISGALFPYSGIALHPREQTIASVLKQKGYHTGMVGKWHLGSRPPHLPVHFGFDEYLGLPYSNDMWPVDYDGKPITDTSTYRGKYPPLPLLEDEQPIKIIRTLEDQGMLTQMYTRRAVSFIERQAGKPFFLYVAHSMPHVPIYASPDFLGKSGAGLFGDMMQEVDWSVGEILGALQRTGVLEHTLVIFTSDNGPWLSFGNHAGNTGGLREGKGTAWEGGVRVPFIAYWKGRISPGQVCDRMGVNIDILPTIASLTGAPLPALKIDGVDLSPLFRQPRANGPRDEFAYYYDRNNLKAIRKGKWKMVFPHQSQTYLNSGAIGANGFPGKTGQVKVAAALYDLEKDPGEQEDVQVQFPEIVKQLETIAEKYRAALGDDLNKRTGNEVRPAAQVNIIR